MKKTTIYHKKSQVQPTWMSAKAKALVPGIMLCLSSLFITTAQAQVTLPASPTSSYTENFDGMGTGGTTPPSGWTTRTSANSGTITPRGTATGALIAGAVTATTGSFYNYPSASSGRCLGIRQSGAFGDPGASFEFAMANTTGRTSFSMTIEHQMLNVQGRSTTWSIQYSVNGINWTTLGTYADPGVVGVTNGSYSFGSALDNISTTVYIRVVALSASTGSNNRDSYGIDNFVLSWVNPSSCTAPTGLAAANTTTTTADLSWNTVSGANGYEYTVDQNSGSPSAAGTATTATSYTATGLTPATTYYLHVRTDCGSGTYSSWATTSFTTAAIPPCGSITGLVASNITTNSADLNWNSVSGIVDYEYTLDQSSANPSAAGTATLNTTYSATSLLPATVYYIHVRTDCGSSNLSAWNTYSFSTASIAPCGTVTAISASNITGTTTDLSWTNVPAISNYEYVVDQTTSDPASAGTAVTTNSYSANGLAPASVYYMHVRTDCGGGNLSAWTTYSFTTACASVASIAAANITTTAADLSWTTVSGTTSYEYVLDQTNANPSATGTSVITNSYSATGLTPASTYYMHVRTNCSSSPSAWTTYSFTTLTPCGNITGLTSTSITTTSANLNWNTVSGINNYEYVLDQTAAAPSAAGTAVTTNSYAATGLTPTTVYYMHVRTDCGSSNLSAWTTYSFTTLTPCGNITGLTASNIATTTATLTWNTVSGIVNYAYVIDQNSANPSGAGTSVITNSYAATGLTPSTTYYMHVRTNCGTGNLSAWTTYSFTTLTPCGNVCGLTATNIGTTSANLNWNIVLGIANYEYILDQSNANPSTAGTAVTTNSYAATGLSPATTYYMHVRTNCGSNNLSAWTTYSFTTLTPCGNITGLTGTNIGTTSATLNWNSVSGINNYEYTLDQNAGNPSAAGTSVTTNSYSATGLTPSTTYYMHVRTNCGTNNLSAWTTYSFTTLTPCGNITGLMASNILFTSADLNWNSVSGINSYEYVLDQTATAPAAAGTAITTNSYSASGLTQGTVYYMHVRTDCGSSNLSAWNTYSFTTLSPCGNISGLTANNIGTMTADLTWNSVSGVLNYEYTLDQNAGNPSAAGTSVTTNSYSASGLTPTTVYYIHVRTNCGPNNLSAWTTYSFTTLTPCGNVSGLTAGNITSTSADLSWNTVSGINNFEYTVDQTSSDPAVAGTAITTNSYSATSLTPGTVYYLHVRTDCGSGNTSVWATYSFTTTTPCGNIGGITSTNVTTNSANLNWNAVAGIVDYEYVLDQTATAPAAAGTAITTNSYAATSLAPGNTYYIHVRTDCGNGNTSAWMTYSFTTVSNCPAPGSLSATNITTNSAKLAWTSGGSASFDYVIDQTATSPSTSGTNIATTTYTATSLTPATVYYLHVRANCGGGNLSAWVTLSFTTSVVATGIDNNTADLSSQVTLFPNPVTDVVNVQSSTAFNNGTITVSDVNGKILFQQSVNAALISIDTKDFAAGVYFLHLQTPQGQLNRRFIKQ